MHHEKNSCMLVNNNYLFMASTGESFFFSFFLVSIKKNKQTVILHVSQKRDHIMTTNLSQGKALLGYPNDHLNKRQCE